MDLMIAAAAAANGPPLYTRNAKDESERAHCTDDPE